MSERKNIRELLGSERLFFDGGMGSLLIGEGLTARENPGTWNVLHPDVVRSIHKAYLDAGSDIITSNTFPVNRFKFTDGSYSAAELARAAIGNIKAAIALAEAERAAAVAEGKAVYGPGFREHAYAAIDIGPLGQLLAPMGSLSFADAVEAFREVIEAGAEAGADLVICETFTDSYELKAAVTAAKECCELPVIATLALSENGRLLTGGDIASTVTMLEGLGVDALGFNCGFGPDQMLKFLPDLLACTSLPVLIQSNAGLPKVVDGETVYMVAPEEFAENTVKLASQGVQILGGCCGTTPKHIAAEIKACASIPAVPTAKKEDVKVCSFAKTIELEDGQTLTAELPDEASAQAFAQALAAQDADGLSDQAEEMADCCGDLLRASLGGDPEAAELILDSFIEEISGTCYMPMLVAAKTPEVLELALRKLNGRPAVDLIGASEAEILAALPAAARFGSVILVCEEARSAKVLAEAEAIGIPACKLVAASLATEAGEALPDTPGFASITLE